MILRALPRRLWRQLGLFAVLFALFFSLIVTAEYLFVRHERTQAVASGLRQTVDEVSNALNYTERWSLINFRQADIQAPSYFVFGPDGLLIDVSDFRPGFIVSAIPIQEFGYNHPTTITTSVGESWLVEARKVTGGLVVAGILSTNARSLKDPNKLLATELAKFGATLKDAIKVKPSDINNSIDGYATLDDFGEVKSALDGIPLRVKLNLPLDLRNETVYIEHLGGKDYAVWSHQIPPIPALPVGRILAFDDITDESAVLGLYRRFNIMIASAAWAVALLLVAVFILKAEVKRRQQEISLEEALKAGEGPTIEFKAGIVDRNIAQTMAAFGNTDSGNIFLGVNDNAEVVGLHDAGTPKERDNWQLRISELAQQVVQPALLVYPKFFTHENKVVLRLFIPRGPAVAYTVQREAFIRHLTSVRKAAGADDFQTILKSHQRYWG
jgi:hypothetical protein